MCENKFWISVWSVVAIGFVSLASVLCYSSYMHDKLLAEALKEDPSNSLQIACALDVRTSTTPTSCVIYLSKMKAN